MEKKTKESTYHFIQITTVLFIVEIIVAHFIYAKNIYTSTLSEYALGKHWYIVSSGLFLTAINYLLLSIKFLEMEEFKNRFSRIGSYILVFVSLNTFLLTVFQAEIGTVTIQGQIHVVAAHLHFIFLPVSTVFLAITIKHRSFLIYKYFTITFSGVVIITGLILTYKSKLGICGYSGLIQKSLILLILFWIMFTSIFFEKRSLKEIR